MLDLLDTNLRSRAPALRDQFRHAQPFPHIVVDNFFDADFSRALIREFPAFDKEKARNEFGEHGRKAVFQDLPSISPTFASLDRLLRSGEFLELVGNLTGIPGLLYDPDYVGGGTHENLSGQELDPHIDFNYHPKTKTHRRLNLIVFLNPEWKAEWGGSLELHHNPWLPPEKNAVKAILPVANRAVLFETSERSWHGFTRIQIPDAIPISRRSVAVYFYTKDRPPEETASSHATVYVPRPLPPHISAGRTLSSTDIDEIRDLINRRDRQIRFLYDREKAANDLLDGIVRSPTFRVARLLAWPLRKLRGN
jgi:hypothetical protein